MSVSEEYAAKDKQIAELEKLLEAYREKRQVDGLNDEFCSLCGGSEEVEIKDCASCVYVNDNGQCRSSSPCPDKSLLERFIRNPLLKIRYKPCPNGCKQKGSE